MISTFVAFRTGLGAGVGHTMFERSVFHPSRAVQKAVAYVSMEFKE